MFKMIKYFFFFEINLRNLFYYYFNFERNWNWIDRQSWYGHHSLPVKMKILLMLAKNSFKIEIEFFL